MEQWSETEIKLRENVDGKQEEEEEKVEEEEEEDTEDKWSGGKEDLE